MQKKQISKEKQPSIKKNFIYSTAYQILSVLTPFITAPYISRVLGAEQIGIQSYTQSLQQYFVMFAALGTITYGSRIISMNRDDPYKRSKLFWEIELMVVGTTMAALVGWIALIINSAKYKVYYEVLSIGIFSSLLDISWFFNGMEQFGLTVTRNAIFKILGVVLLFLFIKGPDDLLLYVFILMTSTFLSNLTLWPYMRKFLVRVNLKDLNVWRHLPETFVYFIPTIATSVYTVLDKTLLGLITDDAAQNGYYQQAEKIINLAKSMVFTAINSVVGVRNSYLFSEKRFDEIRNKIEMSFNFIFLMGFACCFGIIGVAKSFVPFFFGNGYEPVTELLYIFSPIIVIIGVSNCLGAQYYTPVGKRKQSTVYLIVGSIVNLGMNLILIPSFGAKGAAVASVFAELIISYLYAKNCNEFFSNSIILRCGLKKLIAGIGMGVVVYRMNYMNLNPFLLLICQIALGAVVYLGELWVLRDDWLVNILKNRISNY